MRQPVEFFLLWILLWILFGVVSAVAASNKGRSAFGWFFVGLILGPFGLILSLLVSAKKLVVEVKPRRAVSTRKCPYCAEQIKAEAIKCRFCGERIEPVQDEQKPSVADETSTPSGPSRANRAHAARASKKKRSKARIVGGVVLALVLLPVIIGILSPRKARQTSSKPWYGSQTRKDRTQDTLAAKPSLIQGTVADWRRASREDRIRACERMVRIAARSSNFWNDYARNRLRYAAGELEKCITIAAPEAPATMKISEMGATCLLLMQYDL